MKEKIDPKTIEELLQLLFFFKMIVNKPSRTIYNSYYRRDIDLTKGDDYIPSRIGGIMFENYLKETIYDEYYDDYYEAWLVNYESWTRYYGPFTGADIKEFLKSDENGLRPIDGLGHIWCEDYFTSVLPDRSYWVTSDSDGYVRLSRVRQYEQ